MDLAQMFNAPYWAGLSAGLQTAAASASPASAIIAATLVGALYGFLAGLGRGLRQKSGAISEAARLAFLSARHAGAAMLFFVWILANTSRPIFDDPGLMLHAQVFDWLTREYSFVGLLMALPVTLLFGAAFIFLFLTSAASLVRLPFGAVAFLPDIIALIFISLTAIVRVLAYTLIRHPASHVVLPALGRDHSAIDAKALSRALTPSRRALTHPPPRFISERKRRKAEALESKLLADTRLAEAVIARERARAALRDAKQHVHAMRPRFWRWS